MVYEVTLPTGDIVRVPDTVPENQVQGTALRYAYEQGILNDFIKEQERQKKLEGRTILGEVGAGLGRGLQQTKALAVGAGSQLAGIGVEKLGAENAGQAVQNWGANYYANEMEEAEQNFPRSVEGIQDVKSVEDGARLVSSYVGEFLPDLVGMAATGGVGSVVAKTYAKKRLGKELAESMVGDVIKAAGKKGMERGVIVGSVAQNVPASFKNLEEKGVPKEEAATVGIIAGSINSYLDKVFPTDFLGSPALREGFKGSFTRKIIKQMGLNAGKGAVAEGLTESAQEAVDMAAERIMGKNPDLTNPENIFRMLNAGLAGVVGGGVAGGVKGGVTALADPLSAGVPDTGKTLTELSEEVITPESDIQIKSEQEAGETLEAAGVDPKQFTSPDQKIQKAEDLVQQTVEANAELTGTKKPDTPNFSVKEKAQSQKPIGDTYPDTFDPTFPVDPFLVPETSPDPVTFLRDVAGLSNEQISQMSMSEIKKQVPKFETPQVAKPQAKFQKPDIATGDIEFADPELGYSTTSSPRSVELFQDLYRKNEEKFLRNRPESVQEFRGKETINADDPPQSVESFIRTTPVGEVIRPEDILSINDPSIQERPVGDVIREVEAVARRPDSPLELLTDGSFLKARDTDFVPTNVDTVTRKPVIKPTKEVQQLRVTSDPKTLQNAVKVLKQKSKSYKVPFDKLATSLEKPDSWTPTQDNIGSIPLVYSSLALGEGNFAETEPVLLETWRYLKDESDLFTPKNRQDLTNSKTQMINTISKEFELSRHDVAQLGQDEVEAQAFALYSNYKMKNKRVPKMGAAGNVFNKTHKFLNDTGNTLRSVGISDTKTLFNAPNTDTNKAVNDMSTRLRNERYRVLSENNIRRHNEMNAANSNTFDRKAYKESPFLFKMGSITSAIRAASRPGSPLAPLVNRVMKRDQSMKNYHHHFFINTRRLFSRSNEQMRMVFDIAVEQKLLRNKTRIDEDGYLVYKKRDGKTYRLKDKGLSEDYMKLQNMFQDVLTAEVREMTHRVKPVFDMYEIPSDISLENLETFIQNNRDILEESDIETLSKYVENVRSREGWGSYDYVPFKRFGNVGVVVEDKTLPSTGQKGERNVAFLTYETDKNGKPKKESVKEFEERLQEYKKDPKRYKISNEFSLTRNNITNFLNDRQITLELVSQLLAQDRIELADSLQDMLQQEVAFKGFARHFASSENLEGYSKDSRRVLASYFMNASSYLSGLEHNQEIRRINTDIQTSGYADTLKNYANNFVESNTSMEDPWINVRAFNYIYTMGFNFSSGILQPVSLMTTVPGVLTQYNGSLLQSGKYIVKAGKDLKAFMSIPEEGTTISAFDFYNKETYDKLVKKGDYTSDEANEMRQLVADGYVQPGITNENVGAISHMTTLGRTGMLREKFRNATRMSGVFLQTFEEQSRYQAARATQLMLREPGMLNKAHDYLMKYDALYAEQSQGIPNRQAIIQRTIDMGLGHFGREARAPYQNTWVGAFAVPFSTFPHQMMENIWDMAVNRGMGGRKAALKAMIPLVLIGGIWAVPGMSLMKELTEALLKQFGEDEDIEGLIMEEMNELFGTPTAGMLANQGVINTFGGMDVSRRVSLEPPGQNTFLALAGIRGGADDVLGVPGSAAGALVAGIRDMYTGKAPLEALSSAMPSAFKNLYRGLIQLPTEGLKYRGSSDVIVQPEKYRGVIPKVQRSLGFTPGFEGQTYRANERIFRKERELDIPLRRYRTRLINSYTKILQASKDKDDRRKKEGQQDLLEAKKEFRNFLRKERYPEAGKYFQRTLEGARKEARFNLQQRKRPEEVRKRVRPYLRDIEDLYGIQEE